MPATRSLIFGTGPVAQASISCGTTATKTAHRKVVPIPRPAHAAHAAKASKLHKPLPRVRLVVRAPRLFLTLRPAKVLARVTREKKVILTVRLRELAAAWRPASYTPPKPLRRSQRVRMTQH